MLQDNLTIDQIKHKLADIVADNTTVLFMKGEKDMPACGFSAGALEMLNRLEINYSTINVLASNNLRQAIKEFSDWPTFPQLYHNGELIGGYDIMVEMYESGELEQLFKQLRP